MLRPVVAALGQLEDAAAPDVGVAIGLRDFLAVPRDVVEHETFAQRQVAERDLRRAPRRSQDLVEQDRAGHREVGAPRLEARHAQPLLEVERDQILAHARGSAWPECGGCAAARRAPARSAAAATAPRLRIVPDVPMTRSKPARAIWCRYSPISASMWRTSLRSSRGSSGSVLTKRSVSRMTPSLKLRPSSTVGAGAARHLDAAAADVDDHGDVARHADAVDRRQVDEARFFGAGDDAGADARLLGDGAEELAAVFGLADRRWWRRR